MNKEDLQKSPQPTTVVSEIPTTIIPEQKIIVNDYDIDAFLEKRKEFIEKVNAIMVEGKDYHVIQGKKSLAKGGAEKIASIFGWNAEFVKDQDVVEAFADIKGIIAFVCDLSKHGQRFGQGRGAATLAKNGNDPNKTVKMAQKSAFIDGVLRASGLSDFFTQDLGPDDEGSKYSHLAEKPATGQNFASGGVLTASDKQLKLIKELMLKKNVDEETVYADGFDLKNLTGGKEGTASELIEHLFKYRTQGRDSSTGNLTVKANLLIKDLEQCNTPESYQLVSTVIKEAKENGHLTVQDWKAINDAAKKVVERLG